MGLHLASAPSDMVQAAPIMYIANTVMMPIIVHDKHETKK